MQQIERYGVIALLFLLVTIVVVALWDGGDPAQAGGSEGEKVAQVDQNKANQSARNTINRRQTPVRGTRTQAQNRARSKADQRADLNRGSASRNTMDQRSRLIDPNSRPLRPRNQTDRKQPVQRDLTPRNTTSKRNTLDTPAFKAELPRGRNQNQYGGGSKALGNVTNLASDPIPAVRDLRKKADQEKAKRQLKPVKGPMYLIKPGDSLQRIARHTLGDADRWEEIQQLNGMRNTVVIAGRKLRLPVGANPDRTSYADAKNKAKGVTEAASKTAAGSGYYAVKSGDSLSQIAQDELGSVKRQKDILALNPGLTAKNLRAGSKIRMPVRGKNVVKNSAKNSSKKTSPKKRSKPKADSRYVVH